MPRIIAIIPARSGSKRLPNKNIIDIMGKPMIAWTIEAALESKIFSEVLVSTDSKDIADLSRKLGAFVPFLRDPKDADDYTPVSVATINALIQMEEYKSVKYDIVVQLMANCPCRTASDIINSYNNFLVLNSNFQISVFKFGWMNPWWAVKLVKISMEAVPIFPEAFKKRSQDLKALFCPTGAVWIAKANLLKKSKTFYGNGYKIFPISWQSAVDIDEEDDFLMAKMVLLIREQQKKEK